MPIPRRSSRRSAAAGGTGLAFRKRKADARAASGGAGAQSDGSTVAIGDLAHDGEPEAGAQARRAFHAVEALENVRTLGFRNSRPIVLHLEERGAIAPPGAQRHEAAFGRIAERVVEQVGRRLE